MDIFIGLVCIGAGVAVILASYWLEHSVIHFALAERFLGPGSGTLGYKLVGLLLIAFGVAIAFGVLELGNDSLTAPDPAFSDSPAPETPGPAPTTPTRSNFAQ